MAKREQWIKSEEEAKDGLKYQHDDSVSLRNGRMVNNKLLSDVTFIVGPGKERIYAHKLHLVTASEYFYTLFYGSFAEAQLDEIELKDEDPEMFLTILRLMYGADVEINTDNIRDIYDRAAMYLLPTEYYKPLVNFLNEQIIDKDSAWEIFIENQHYQFQLVDEVCLPYIQSNPLYYFRKKDFTKIEEELMLKIVGLQQINCTDEQLLSALETCEFTNAKYATKELKKLVSSTRRQYFSHKFSILGRTFKCSDNPGEIPLKLTLTSRESIGLYGIGVYLVPTEGTAASVALFAGALEDDGYRKISSLNFPERYNPRLEIVDLMFEEITLRKGESSSFYLDMNNSNGYICFDVNSALSLVHDNIKITFSEPSRNIHAFAYFWAKCPKCGVGSKQASQRCCQYENES